MLIDMIHDNHGEPPFKTRYRDPNVLKAYGYEAIVIPDALAGLPSAKPQPLPVKGHGTIDLPGSIDHRVRQAREAGMQVFFYGDAFLLPRGLVEGNSGKYCCADQSGRICPGKAGVYEALQKSVVELFERWPVEDGGLIMRVGEVYPEATPHMVGNAVFEPSCPVCRGMSAVERQRRFIRAMHETVVEKLGRTYVHRAWHAAGAEAGPTMHDDVGVYREVTAELPQSERLAFSFKLTRGDFRYGQPYNPVLQADGAKPDGRPKWIELQCQREYEGKGAFPSFQAVAWSEFLETSGLLTANPAAGGPVPQAELRFPLRMPTAPLPGRVLKPGYSLWGWSRGGGWGGPYVQREEWVDANVYALGRFHRDPGVTPRQLAREWSAKEFGIDGHTGAADVLTDLLLRSGPTIHHLVSSSLPELGDIHALRDDHLDIEALWLAAGRVAEPATAADAACDEKLSALQGIEHARRLFEHVVLELPNRSQARDVANTLTFYNSFAGAVAHAFCGFVRYMQWDRGGKTNAILAAQATDHLEHAQAHWLHHTQRHTMLPGAPSVFHENTFWERTNGCMEELEKEN